MGQITVRHTADKVEGMMCVNHAAGVPHVPRSVLFNPASGNPKYHIGVTSLYHDEHLPYVPYMSHTKKPIV